MSRWMIYGATGYTGRLVVEEAVKRGHKPVLGGRSAGKLQALAEQYGLEYVAFPVSDSFSATGGLQQANVALVYHAAGPFVHTSDPMLKACLAVGAHYLDITGEIPVYQNAFRYDAAAREKGIAIIPGVGFDVIPSDCLLKYVADQLPDATHLEVVVDTLNTAQGAVGVSASAGTLKSMLELLPTLGNVVRRNGELVPVDFGAGAKTVRFPHGELLAMPAPWGDVEMGYHTTGIPNITAYLTFPPATIALFRASGTLLRLLLRSELLRGWVGQQVDRLVSGPSEAARAAGRSYVYAQVRNAQGAAAQAWLETLDGYTFTAVAGVRVVERVLAGSYRGALSPAAAFGADFVLEIAGTQRYDTLP